MKNKKGVAETVIGLISSRGSVTIPSFCRTILGLNTGDAVLISIQNGQIIITPSDVVPRLSDSGQQKMIEFLGKEDSHVAINEYEEPVPDS